MTAIALLYHTDYLELCFVSDTIPGRQCMASCFFLLKQFEDVLIYLNSIKVSSFMTCLINVPRDLDCVP